jgi:hypothetical protein
MATPNPEWTCEGILASPLLWGFICLVAVAVGLSGRLDVSIAKWVLLAAWLMAVFSLYRFSPILRQPLIPRLLLVMLSSSCVGLFLYSVSAWMSGKPITTPLDSDFRATVIRYGCTRETHELFCDVQYVNTSQTPRTVLTVALTTRGKDENGQHPFIDNLEDASRFGNEAPFYVEPNQPIVKTYRYKLQGEQVGLTKIPGQVFGVLFTIINSDGTMNFVTIEAMMVSDVAGTQALVSISKRNISLDAKGAYIPMENPFVSPSAAPSPVARPKQKQVIQSQDATEKEIRDSICGKIRELIGGGDELLRRMMFDAGVEAQVNHWSATCEAFLRTSLGKIAVKLFRSPAIISFNPIGESFRLSEPWNYQGQLYERISSRTIRLREIMEKVKTGEFEPC